MSSTSVREHARSYLKQLSRETRLTASLAVLDGPEIVYLERMRGLRQAGLDTRVNARRPAYCTAAGKVLLAHLPAAEQKDLLGAMRLTRRALNTLTDPRQLQAQLEQAFESDIAIDDQELAPGVLGLATPVRMANREVIAAVDLVASITAVDHEDLLDSFSAPLLRVAGQISARLGYRRSES
jgi:IclR family pca regulon transcriptional regulator